VVVILVSAVDKPVSVAGWIYCFHLVDVLVSLVDILVSLVVCTGFSGGYTVFS
jgi:hypothetical protein